MTYPKHKLIPPVQRPVVAAGGAPLYQLKRPDYDRVPIDTFLISSMMGTEGRVLEEVARVVKPNNPAAYTSQKKTPEGRLLYVCWRKGMACKVLRDAKGDTFRHVVYPDDPEHHMIAMFKIACDTRRAWSKGVIATRPTLLYRALGLDIEFAENVFRQEAKRSRHALT